MGPAEQRANMAHFLTITGLLERIAPSGQGNWTDPASRGPAPSSPGRRGPSTFRYWHLPGSDQVAPDASLTVLGYEEAAPTWLRQDNQLRSVHFKAFNAPARKEAQQSQGISRPYFLRFSWGT